MKYEVVIGLYRNRSGAPMEEETILTTDDLAEAREEYEALVEVATEEGDEPEDEESSDQVAD